MSKQQTPGIDQTLRDKLSELYHITTEIENKTKEKNKLKLEVMSLIKTNKLEGKKFAIGDRYVTCKQRKQNSGLTQKLLLKSLNDYFGPDHKDQAVKLYKYILANRTVKLTENVEVLRR